jgi:hypothetical protein
MISVPDEAEEALESFAPGGAFTAFDDERGLDARDSRHEAFRIVLDLLIEDCVPGLVQQDGNDDRGVEHHQRGTPYWS